MPTPTVEPAPSAQRDTVPTLQPSRRFWFVAAWILSARLLAWPLFHPEGELFSGRYADLDILFGVPFAITVLAATVLQILPVRRRRTIAIRFFSIWLSCLAGIALVDLAAVAWHVANWDYWFDFHKVVRNGNRPDPELGWSRLPLMVWKDRGHKTGGDVDYRTDENGFRNATDIRSADIVFVGDSFTESIAFREESAFPGLVQRRTRLRAVNLGRSGYGPQQELIVLRKFGLAYHPTYVVWQICEGNDLVDAEHYARWRDDLAAALRGARPHGFFAAYRAFSPVMWNLRKTRPQDFPGCCLVCKSHSKSMPLVHYMADRHDRDAAVRHPFGMRETAASLAEGDRLCREHGAKLIVLFIPNRDRVLFPYLRFGRPGDAEKFLPGGSAPSRVDFESCVGAACKQIGCRFLDLFPPLQERAAADVCNLYFTDDYHLDYRGQEVVADAIVQELH